MRTYFVLGIESSIALEAIETIGFSTLDVSTVDLCILKLPAWKNNTLQILH
jgi:hypothetical protein